MYRTSFKYHLEFHRTQFGHFIFWNIFLYFGLLPQQIVCTKTYHFLFEKARTT